jgi:hypothetical protein
VNTLSENTKLRFDPLAALGPRSTPAAPVSSPAADPAAPVDETESAMRRALGLLGETSRQRPEPERSEPMARTQDRFGSGVHRRRFVQDGDVPVTVLRRDPAAGHETPAAAALPTSSRLQRTEAALAAETAARSQAERTLSEVQGVVRDLQTKIGHADLAKTEAVEALRREREAACDLRKQLEAIKAELAEARAEASDAAHASADFEHAISEERQSRRALEKSLRAAELARDDAERLVQSLSEEAPAVAAYQPDDTVTVQLPVAAPPPRKRGRPQIVRQPTLPELEPEPVKWWLTPAKSAAKRR